MILHLGVTDLPYVQAPAKGRRRKRSAGTVTTGDVAGWLERRYQVMETFADRHGAEIASDLENSVQGALESFLLGAPASINPFGTATSKIEERFRDFLDTREMETLGRPGVPTAAALAGINPRLKRGRGKRRSSFVASGLYQSSFRSWID